MGIEAFGIGPASRFATEHPSLQLKCKPRVKSPASAGLFFTFPAAKQALDSNPASFDPLVGTRQPRADALGKSGESAGVERHSPTIRAGNRIQLVPFHQFSWWNKYQIDPVWSASLGAIYFSDSYASSDDSVYLPGFLRFDAGVYAQIDATWKAQLNIENIFNKGYWASADANNNISPGQPRTFRFKVTAKL